MSVFYLGYLKCSFCSQNISWQYKNDPFRKVNNTWFSCF